MKALYQDYDALVYLTKNALKRRKFLKTRALEVKAEMPILNPSKKKQQSLRFRNSDEMDFNDATLRSNLQLKRKLKVQ